MDLLTGMIPRIIIIIICVSVSTFSEALESRYAIIKVSPSNPSSMEKFKNYLQWLQEGKDEFQWLGTVNGCVVKIPYTLQQFVEGKLTELGLQWENTVSVTKIYRPQVRNGTVSSRTKSAASAEFDGYPLYSRTLYKIIRKNKGAYIDNWFQGPDKKGGIGFKSYTDPDSLDDFYFDIVFKKTVSCRKYRIRGAACLVHRVRLRTVNMHYANLGIEILQSGADGEYYGYFTTRKNEELNIVSKHSSPDTGVIITDTFIQFGKILFSGGKINVKALRISSPLETMCIVHKITFTNQLSITPVAQITPYFNGSDIGDAYSISKMFIDDLLGPYVIAPLFPTSSFSEEILPSKTKYLNIKQHSKCVYEYGVLSYSFSFGFNLTVILESETKYLNDNQEIKYRPINTDEINVSRMFQNLRVYKNWTEPNIFNIEYQSFDLSAFTLPYQNFECYMDTNFEIPFCNSKHKQSHVKYIRQ